MVDIAMDGYFSKILSLFLLVCLFAGTVCIESMVSINYPGQSCPLQSRKPIFWVQKLVCLTATNMMDQDNQLKALIQRKKCWQASIKVEKKVTKFGENIHLENFNHMYILSWSQV